MTRKTLALLLCFLLMASPVWAAITYDATSGQSGEGTTSATHNVTVAAGSNIMIVCVAVRDSAGAVASVSSVTVGGAAATFLVGQSNSGSVVRVEMWYKLAPATGTVSVVATGGAGTDFMVTGGLAFSGVAQSSTFNTPASLQNSGTTVNVTSIASAVGEMVVGCEVARSGTAVVFSAEGTPPTSTERYDNHHDTGTGTLAGAAYTEAGASPTVDLLVNLNESVQNAAVGVSMRPEATSSTRRRGF